MGFYRQQFERRVETARSAGDDGYACAKSQVTLREASLPRIDRVLLSCIGAAQPGANDQNAQRLSDVIDRLSWAFKPLHFQKAFKDLAHGVRGSRDLRQERLPVVNKLLNSLSISPYKRSMEENTAIFESLGILGLKDEKTINSLVTQAHAESRFFAPEEICRCMNGIANLQLHSKKAHGLVRSLCDRAVDIIDQFTMDDGFKLVGALANHLTLDTRIFEHVFDMVATGNWNPSKATIGRLAILISKVNYKHMGMLELAHELVKEELSAFERYCQKAHAQEPIPKHEKIQPKTVLAIARCIRATDALNEPISDDAIQTFTKCLPTLLSAIPPDEGLKVAREIGAVLLVRHIALPWCVQSQIEQRRVLASDVETAPSRLEWRVGQVLHDLGIRFEASVYKASFNLDFLIETKCGRWVNLELDGEPYHMVRCQPESGVDFFYTARNRYRDRALGAIGVSVVRITASEWNDCLTNKRELLATKIPGLF